MNPLRLGLAALASAVLLGTPVFGQDAVMQTARPLEPSVVRLALHPVLLPEGDDEVGLAGRAEWALGRRLALQSRFAFYNDLTFLSAQVLYSLASGGDLELAALGGVHRSFLDERDAFSGLDLALIGSADVGDGLSAYGALDLDREWPPAPFASITRFHIVGGIDLPVTGGVRGQAEFGLGLGDDSPHYVSFGLSWTIGD